MANDTEYGLVAYAFTPDLGRTIRVSEGLEFGMVGINQGIVSNPAAPFGGVKQSGFGREGGPEGIEEYLGDQVRRHRALTPPAAQDRPVTHRGTPPRWAARAGDRACTTMTSELSPRRRPARLHRLHRHPGDRGHRAAPRTGSASPRCRRGRPNLDLLAAQARRPRGGRSSRWPPGTAERSPRRSRCGCRRGAGRAGIRPRGAWPGPDAADRLAGPGADVVLNGITGSIGLRADPGGARRRAAARAGQQGVAHRRRPAGQGAPPRPARSCRSTPSTPRSPSACAAGAPTRCAGWSSPPAAARSAAGRRESLRDVTPEQALAHPTWDMGRVITTNSATLVNKGLEVIEAHLLFDIPFDRIDVVVHPQSIVHSMVEFVDGSTLAQARRRTCGCRSRWASAGRTGCPDAGVRLRLDHRRTTWEFEPARRRGLPRRRAWPAQVGEAGGTYPAVYNAANEECVDAFHAGRHPASSASSTRWPRVVGTSTAAPGSTATLTVEDVLRARSAGRGPGSQPAGGRRERVDV